ncbi:MAG: hypothetical protein WD023_05625 [Ilumatobacteraceae bacterium]
MMVISVEELASWLNAEAARRHVTVEELLDIVAAQFPDRSEPAERFAFAGTGHSGRGDLSERHKQIRDELITEQRNNSE